MRHLFQIITSFLTLSSQGSVATRMRCGGVFNTLDYTFIAESDGERIFKIGQHVAK